MVLVTRHTKLSVFQTMVGNIQNITEEPLSMIPEAE